MANWAWHQFTGADSRHEMDAVNDPENAEIPQNPSALIGALRRALQARLRRQLRRHRHIRPAPAARGAPIPSRRMRASRVGAPSLARLHPLRSPPTPGEGGRHVLEDHRPNHHGPAFRFRPNGRPPRQLPTLRSTISANTSTCTATRQPLRITGSCSASTSCQPLADSLIADVEHEDTLSSYNGPASHAHGGEPGPPHPA